MQLFLHIRITDNQFIFKNETIDNVRKWLPHITLFDIDNFSDTTTIQTAIKAMGMAKKIFISIEAMPGPELGGALKVLNQLIKNSSRVLVDYQGKHDTLDKIMLRFRDQQAKEDLSLEQKVKSFFSD